MGLPYRYLTFPWPLPHRYRPFLNVTTVTWKDFWKYFIILKESLLFFLRIISTIYILVKIRETVFEKINKFNLLYYYFKDTVVRPNMSPWPYRPITENANDLRTVRFSPFQLQTEHGRLFGALRHAVKTETENGVVFGNRTQESVLASVLAKT